MTEALERDDAAADVRAAIAGLQKGAASSSSSPTEPGASPPPVDHDGGLDAEGALDNVAETNDNRPRDEQGRFVAAEKAPEPQPKSAPAKEPVATTDSTKATVPAAQAGGPPVGWSPEAKAEWSKLSPAAQAAVIRREEANDRGHREKSEELQRFKELEGIIAPRRAYYQRFGFKSDAQAINHLLTLSDSIERDPAGTIAHLARHYGVDTARLTGAQAPQAAQTQPQQIQQPDIRQIVSEELGMQFAKSEVAEFERNAPEHYAELKPLMGKLLEIGQAADLKDAYDKALWMTPNLRQKMLEAQTQAVEQKRQEAAKAEIEKKKKAAGASLNGAPHGTPTVARSNAKPGSFHEAADDVRNAIASLR